ncbi:MAG: glutathione peroxidase [Bermanella sp.]|jgi:glutathione peroxidase
MTVYDFSATDIQGTDRDLSDFNGKVLLIVNTASKCGFTPQFEGLESMYKDLAGKGLEILGFPCNQFANQDKGSDSEIAGFCLKNYGVSFPMFSKVEVNGDGEHPLYKYLKSEAKGILGSKKIKWNFTKFLVDQKGQVVRRYAPSSKPEEIQKDVAALLNA